MTEKLKVLGVALVAVFALSVVGVGSAQAVGKFTVPNGPGTALAGAQTETNIFTTKAGEVECSTESFSGTSTGSEETEQTVAPTVSGCTLAGLAATVDFATGGCDYRITAAGAGLALDFICGTGGTIHVTKTGSECVLTILPQTGLTGDAGSNTTVGGAMAISLKSSLSGIHYEFHHGEKCPNKPESTTLFTDGSCRGQIQVTAPGGITYDES